MTRINLYGLGAANLILAHELTGVPGLEIHIYEKNKSGGRKYLVAGKGGFNISNNLTAKEMIDHITPSLYLSESIKTFDVNKLRKWYKDVGIDTYTGSSNKIFPLKGIKPIIVLNSIMKGLERPNVHFHYSSEFIGFYGDKILLKSEESVDEVTADYHVFAFGGSSWSVTGSDGTWLQLFTDEGIKTIDFQPANCGVLANWDKKYIQKYEGIPIKNVSISYNGKTKIGEFILTKYGLEGNAVYPFSNSIFKDLKRNKAVFIQIDFKIQWSEVKLLQKLLNKSGNTSKRLEAINLSPQVIDMLKLHTNKDEWTDLHQIAKIIKHFELPISGVRDLEECISTAGGISIESLNSNFELKSKENHYCIGEMVDWTAPTGGFLLHTCFAMGYTVSRDIIKKLGIKSQPSTSS